MTLTPMVQAALGCATPSGCPAWLSHHSMTTGDARCGAGCARNQAIRASSGDVLFFCDDDDAWLPRGQHVRKAVAAMRADAGLGYRVVGVAFSLALCDCAVVVQVCQDPRPHCRQAAPTLVRSDRVVSGYQSCRFG